MLWCAEDIAMAVGSNFKVHSTLRDVIIGGVQIDSRAITPGDLFIPLAPPIAGRDGHAFIEAAFERGAALALSSRPSDDHRVMQVVNTFDALTALGRAARQRLSPDARVIAVTGSSGKTTLRSWLEHVLVTFDETHASEGSFNNHLGVPLSLARMPSTTRFGIFEVGTNHPGEIGPLSNQIKPDIAVVLNVLPVHIGHFDGIDALRSEKLAITSGLKADGELIIEHDLGKHVTFPSRSFGLKSEAGVSVKSTGQKAGLEVRLGAKVFPIELPAPGVHLQATASACLAVIDYLGLDVPKAIERLRSAPIPKGRGDRITINGITLIDESYNANPESMRFVLTALSNGSKDRTHLILGEMHELGALSQTAHQNLLDLAHGFGSCLAVGPEFAGLAKDHDITYLATSSEIDLKHLTDQFEPGDIVLVKGSNRVFWSEGFVPQLEQALQQRRS